MHRGFLIGTSLEGVITGNTQIIECLLPIPSLHKMLGQLGCDMVSVRAIPGLLAQPDDAMPSYFTTGRDTAVERLSVQIMAKLIVFGQRAIRSVGWPQCP